MLSRIEAVVVVLARARLCLSFAGGGPMLKLPHLYDQEEEDADDDDDVDDQRRHDRHR